MICGKKNLQQLLVVVCHHQVTNDKTQNKTTTIRYLSSWFFFLITLKMVGTNDKMVKKSKKKIDLEMFFSPIKKNKQTTNER